MKRSLPVSLALSLLLLSPLPAPAQTPAPVQATPPASPKPALPTAPAATTQPTPTIQARTSLVILDVAVTDRAHNPIHNLKASDFQLKDSGNPQTIKVFEEHTAANAIAPPPLPTLPPGVFTNYSPAPPSGPINVLLIDRLNTPIESQSFLNQQLIAFIHTMKPGTRIAIFGLTTQLIYLQGFTSDPKLLLAALEARKNLPRQSPLLDSGSAPDKISDVMSDAATAGSIADTAAGAAALADVQQFEAEMQSQLTQNRVRLTLTAMNTLARYLSGLPGRKNLIWFSGSFPISILPDGDLQNPFGPVADLQDEFRIATNLLGRAQVAVYPIDARGLKSSPVFDASQSGSKYGRNPTAFAKANNTFLQQTADEHGTMLQMAHDTGGQAFTNTNGLAEAVSKAIDQGSTYYTIAYTPTEAAPDGRFHKLQLSLTPTTPSASGAQLDYRRGYFADTPPHEPRKQLTASPKAPLTPQRQAIRSALLRGAPEATQILFKVLAVPSGPPTETTLTEGNVAPPATKGPFRTYTVNYAVSPQDIRFELATPGHYSAAVEFLVFVYDSDGNLLNTQQNGIKATLETAAIQSITRTGLQFHQAISVPAKGENFLRIAVHDLQSDHIGSVEVPIAAVRNLPLVELPSTRPAPPTLNNLPQ